MKRFLSSYPNLVKEFHPTKNGNLSPNTISSKDQKKIWWKCNKGTDHVWQTTTHHRAISKTGCPFCSNNKVSVTNCLSTVFPEISKEWHPTKNDIKKPTNVIAGSGKKFWWKCQKGDDHEWEASCDQRKKSGCPYCAGRKLSKSNSLQTIYPELIKFWHPTKNSPLEPKDVVAGSSTKHWWVCEKNKNHEWLQEAYNVANNKKKCPYCSLRKLSDDNNLLVLYPKISEEFHPTKNHNLKTYNLLPNTTKKVWWKCLNGHEWITSVSKRTIRGQNCPNCSNQSSIPEIRIYTEIKSIFFDTSNREKIRSREIDIYIPSLKCGIEYDGSYFHANSIKKDQSKTEILSKLGIYLIRVRELPLKKLSKDDVLVSQNGVTKNDLNAIFEKILDKVSDTQKTVIKNYIQKKKFVNEKEFKKYLSFFPSPFPEKSLENTHKELIELWHHKNLPLKPSNFSYGSVQKVWWKCNVNPKHEWEAKIASVAKGHRCPICVGQKVSSENNLKYKYPSIAKEWHPTKNGDSCPTDYTWGSGKKVWWKCSKGDDHEWEAAIRHRTSNNSGCPFCTGNRLSKDNNLAAKFPTLAKEWHSKKNNELTPHEVMPGAKIKVWWLCNNGHEWLCSINKRTSRGQSCALCKKQ
jgi:very-short-patch-repair endonuclease